MVYRFQDCLHLMMNPAIRNTPCGSDAIQLFDIVYTVHGDALVTIKTK